MFAPSATGIPFGEQVARLEKLARAVADGLDPDAVPGCDAAGLYARLDRVARIVTATRTVLARRVAEAKAYQGTSHQNAAEHLAALSGSSLGAARDELKTSAALPDLPDVDAGMRSGDLSPAQTNVIADAGTANPGAARDLIDAAKRKNLNELREQAGRAKAAADPNPEERRKRIHTNRRCSRFTRSDGTWVLHAEGTPEDGARIAAMLDQLSDELFTTNRDGERLSRDQRAFDALVTAADRATRPAAAGREKTAKGTNPRFLGLIRADAAALQRGRVQGDELCEITGIGPISVQSARRLLGDAIVKLVITRGVDVANVTHLGRGPNTAQKIALAWTMPTCTVEGCSRTHTEYDHRIDWRITHHTRLDETDPLCNGHHDRKTHHGWALVPGTGKRALVPPHDPRHPDFGTIRTKAPPTPLDQEQIQAERSSIAQRVIDHLETQHRPAQPTTG